MGKIKNNLVKPNRQAKVVGRKWIACICFSVCYLGLVGCSTLKESGVVATGSAIGAGVGTAISGGVGAPILGAMTGAFVTDVATEVLTSGSTETQTIINAPDNFFTLLQKLIELGGWALILIFIVPMILGWILPGPLERKRASKS